MEEDMDEYENYEMILKMELRENEFWERMANIRRELYDLPNKKEAEMARKNDKKEKEEVNLYNPKFVHFEWDEGLKEKVGFYGSNIGQIRSLVNNEGTYPSQKGTIKHNRHSDNHVYSESVYPFESSYGIVWQFFYYDPNLEVKWSYFKEGKKIQYRIHGEWRDISPDCYDPSIFDDDFEYRIKPEEESKTEPTMDVKIDVNIKNTSNTGSIKIQINGKEIVFNNAEEARLVLGIKED